MKNRTFGIGKYFAGIWVGTNKIDDEENKFLKVSLFPIDVIFIFNNVSFCLRIHLFNHLKLSSIVEIN
jgi:hypothetical protein|tara:strand:- start:1473 stop:1676 length:204 start_codon:yes stop_codon:yes gene_type:complete